MADADLATTAASQLSWDRDGQLRRAGEHQDAAYRAIARMWVYHRDLELAGIEYSAAKSRYERLLGKIVVTERAAGERSAEVCIHKAMQDDDVYVARVQYRAAEQRVSADKEALRILHAELDDDRTRRADDRAAGAWQARSQT
ncbi:hypothetical protein [Auraticoccus monumenti]|uniref:Uncharacterized protein n=1 Tax=Auraticoccus monumenti TaxID=675864 RepID=A0A1G6UQ39_9ACTN|nr:hypothetical protein [Auraticoccus monumenti]SDD42806.1 hypothetical protein SAMN04489747_0927 [Auraticoccus monumenti]